MRRGQTLVATLIVLAIIAILAVALFKGSGMFSSGPNQSPRKDGKGTTTLGLAQYKARDEVCRSNIGQVRMSIGLNTTTDDQYPASLQELKFPTSFFSCPIGKEPYAYDPATGKVSCPHPGHENY